MSKYKIIQIICWVIVFLVFLGMALWFLFGKNMRIINVSGLEFLNGPYEREGSYSIEATDVENIDISWTAGRVTVTPYDGNEIQVVEYAQRHLEEDEKLIYSTSGGSLQISYCERKQRWLTPLPSKKLEVYLPKKLASDIGRFALDCVSATADVKEITSGKLNIKTVSGEVYLSGINADTGDITSTSGTLELNNISIPKMNFKTVSGEINVDRLDTEDVSAKSTSGSIKFTEVFTKQLRLESVSGEIGYQGSYQEMTANSTSGSISVTDQIAPTGFHIKTVSGEVNIKMPSFDNFKLYKKTVSGDFDCEIPVTTQNESDASYRIQTTSGSIDIKKLN